MSTVHNGPPPISKGKDWPALLAKDGDELELHYRRAIIAILAALLLPALSRSRSQALGGECLNNLRQLRLAWHAYVADNNDHMPLNVQYRTLPDPIRIDTLNTYNWCFGYMGQDACAVIP